MQNKTKQKQSKTKQNNAKQTTIKATQQAKQSNTTSKQSNCYQCQHTENSKKATDKSPRGNYFLNFNIQSKIINPFVSPF